MAMVALSNGPVVLASGSATRRRLLESAGLAVIVDPPSVDEDEVKRSCRAGGLPPQAVAEALAELKAARVAARHPDRPVIGADQMLECDGVWFDKPADAAAARAQLLALAGRRHRLISCAVVFQGGQRVWHTVDEAVLTMRPLEPDFLDRYLAVAGPAVLSSVGGYQLEGPGAQLFTAVTGDFFTVLGLPLLPLLGFLRTRGVLPS
ncbi:Maf family protein [Rhodocista pekingensis]|uniref:Nucleoside triphosphate pyrophosphatase n=1 Tax=Rhodocista pekingensis TaxID=201185 RepID=A0ABW2KRD0_9PROT